LLLVRPAHQYLAGYVDTLQRGWSPDNLRGRTRLDELEKIERDAQAKGPRFDYPMVR
jgi:hypothetical protein